MFRIGGLVVLCGLLAQTRALLEGVLQPLGPAPPLAAGPLGSALPLNTGLPSVPSGLSAPTDLAGGLIGGLTNGLLSGDLLGIVQNLPLLDILKAGGGNSGGLLGGLLGTLNSVVPLLNNLIDLKITDPQLLELGLVQSPNGHRLYVTIPLGLILRVKTPLVGNLVRLDVKLNITAELSAVRDEQGRSHLVLGDCTHSPGSLKISLLDGIAPLPVQSLVDNLTGVLNNVLPELVQGKVCPLLNEVLKNLDITLVHNIVDRLIHGTGLVLKI